ncbi:hypothetical protein E2I00_019196, partial [Balaenoptera physalus]
DWLSGGRGSCDSCPGAGGKGGAPSLPPPPAGGLGKLPEGSNEADARLLAPPCSWVFLGVTFTNTSELGERLWDVADYVIPPQGENVFFVITNLVVTPNQRQETCAESESIPDALCCEDSDCPPGEPVVAGNGVRTGRCLRAGSEQKGTCEIFAWCPVETKSSPAKPLLGEAEDFTVYIKNFIRFPKFNFSKTNVLDTTDRAFLKSCKYGPKDPYCPIFRLGSVVSWTGSNFQEIAVQEFRLNGTVTLIELPLNVTLAIILTVWTTDFQKTLSLLGTTSGKFNIIPTIINVGSGVALMGVVSTSPPPPLPSEHLRGRAGGTLPQGSCPSAPERTRTGEGSFFCDLVLIYFIKKSHFYRDKKYEEVRDLEVLAQMAESSQQSVAPDAAGLAEQPEVQDGGGAQKENGCVCRQLLQPARSGRQGNGKVNVEQLQNLQTVEA